MRKTDSLITDTNPKSPTSEAYRMLRTNIQYISVDKPIKSIVVTSSIPMEGKTTTIVNLAVTFAQMGHKVILIDTDLRKPKVHRFFWELKRTGLTNYLASHDDYHDFISHSSVENLDVLACGTIPPNPAELLASNKMKQFMESIYLEYDFIFLDAPPVSNVTDASIISTYVDGTIIVASSGRVEIETLKKTKEQLEKVNANILGVVLNRLDRRTRGNTYYYSYGYYEDSPVEGMKKTKKNRKNSSQDIVD